MTMAGCLVEKRVVQWVIAMVAKLVELKVVMTALMMEIYVAEKWDGSMEWL